MIACLLVNGAEIDSEYYEKRAPLIWAMTHIFTNTTQTLKPHCIIQFTEKKEPRIGANSQPKHTSAECRGQLLCALKNELVHILQHLVRCGANIDLSQPKIWFDLGGPGLRYIRFTQKPGSSGFKLIDQSPNKHDWLPSAEENILW